VREIIVDSFAGGGGASLGIQWATGHGPDIAINHDVEAIAMHRANHPETFHLITNVWKVDPYAVAQGRPVGLMWASPDCKHFSKAKGGKPVSKNIRDLGWVVYGWAKTVRPRVIILENVEEWQDWGPLVNDMPCPDRKGQTFRRFVTCLRNLGYKVEWRELVAADYGSPTTRKRLFLVARCDGLPIVWPKASHGKPDALPVKAGKLKPWRTAAECIDWTLPCYSIFITAAEARTMRKRDGIKIIRPLATNTMARIARGVKRYVLDAEKPFIVPVTHTGDQRVHSVDDPLRTMTCAQRGEHAVIAPFIAKHRFNETGTSIEAPLPTVTANSFEKRPGGATPLSVVAAGLINTRNGEREGQEPRVRDLGEPAPTTTAHGSQGGVAVAFMAQHTAGSHPARPARGMDEPVSTVTQKGCQQSVVAANIISLKGSDRRDGSVDAPAPAQCAGGTHTGVVAAFMQRYFGTEQDPRLDEPVGCQTTKDRSSLIEVPLGMPVLTAAQYERAKLVAKFLRKFGCWDGGEIVTTRDGSVIVDIGMRMLVPRELFRAQGFEDYEIAFGITEKGERIPLTKTAQIRLVGNSVCPQVAEALVLANYQEQDITERGVPEFALTAAE